MNTIELYAKSKPTGYFKDLETASIWDAIQEDDNHKAHDLAEKHFKKTSGSLTTRERLVDTEFDMLSELKDIFSDKAEEETPEGTLWRDLVFDALARVDWNEIAERLVDHYAEQNNWKRS